MVVAQPARERASPPASRLAQWVVQTDGGSASAEIQRAMRSQLGPDGISLAGGLPAPELFPLEALERAYGRAIREDGPRALQYGDSQGVLALREIVCQRLARRGIEVSVEQVLITSGSTQGLHAGGRLLLDPGDIVVTEAPTFGGALLAWQARQPRYVCFGVDADGLAVEELAAWLARAEQAPKLVYALPTFQNPTGALLSLPRRQRLLDLARQHSFLIVEDDPYGEIWFDAAAPAVPPIRALEGARDHVLYLGSFSKILAPGIRLGFAVAPPHLIAKLVQAKRGVDLHTDGLVQYGVVRLLRDEDFDLEAHVASVRSAYRVRRDALLDALEAHLPPTDVRWTRPAGGFFVWAELPAEMDAVALLARAVAEEVAFVPGPGFFPNGGGRNALRLSFSHAAPERLGEGIRRLARAYAGSARAG